MARVEQKAGSALPDELSFGLLRVGRTKLLVPRRDIRVLELTVDMERDTPPARGVGWIAFGQQRCPVYCPSMGLEWQTEVPGDRMVCAVIGTGEQVFGLLCSEAALLKSQDVVLHDVPAAMAAPGSPFHQLAIHAGTLACVTSAVQIKDLLSGHAIEQPTLQETH